MDVCRWSIYENDSYQLRGDSKSIRGYDSLDPAAWAEGWGAAAGRRERVLRSLPIPHVADLESTSTRGEMPHRFPRSEPAAFWYAPRMERSLVAIGLVAALLSAGCTTRLGDFTILSGENVALNPNPERRSVEGRDCAYRLLFLIPLGSLQPNIEEAMDDAFKAVPDGNIMTDVTIYAEPLFMLLATRNCFRVRGDIGVQE